MKVKDELDATSDGMRVICCPCYTEVMLDWTDVMSVRMEVFSGGTNVLSDGMEISRTAGSNVGWNTKVMLDETDVMSDGKEAIPDGTEITSDGTESCRMERIH